MDGLWKNLKNNRYFRIIAAYLMIGWIVMQVAEIMGPALLMPDWVLSAAAYILITGLPVVVLITWVLAQKEREAKQAADGSTSGKGIKPMDYAIYGGAVLALVVVIARWALPGSGPAAELPQIAGTEIQTETSPSESGEAQPTGLSIAVLPFDDMSQDNDQEYFSDGITEEIIHALARVDGLNVTARTSSFAFKGQNVDLSKVGELLGVSYIIEGSVRKQGERVRITAQLINTSDNFHLWSETYTYSLEDIFQVQEEISLDIADELKLLLGSEDKDYLAQEKERHPEAYETFLQARHMLANPMPVNLDNAIAFLEDAVAYDPEFSEAWAALSFAYWQKAVYGGNITNELEMAELNALRALSLDNENSQAHVILGLVAAQRRNYKAMKPHLENALSHNNNDPLALTWYAFGLFSVGEIEESLPFSERARQLDPMTPINHLAHANNLIASGDIDQAEEIASQAAQLGFLPARMALADIAAFRGNTDEAVELATPVLKFMTQIFTDEEINRILTGVFVGGEYKQLAVDDMMRLMGEQDSAAQILFPNFFVLLDEPELAFQTFKESSNAFDMPFFVALWSERGKSARQHPEFQQFARDVGLVEYWLQHGWPDRCKPVRSGQSVTSPEMTNFSCI